MSEREKLIQDTSKMTRRMTDLRDQLVETSNITERKETIRKMNLLEELIFANQEHLNFLEGRVDY